MTISTRTTTRRRLVRMSAGAINDRNLCFDGPVIQYLTDPTQRPAEGASCAQTTEPFSG